MNLRKIKIAPEFQAMFAVIGALIFGLIIGYLGGYGDRQEKENKHAAAPKGYYYNPYNRQYTGHVCIDSTHYECDGRCECDGLECPRYRDYQIELTQDGTFFYDGTRFVGFIPYSGNNTIDSLLTQDNQ